MPHQYHSKLAIESLRSQIHSLENQLACLKANLVEAESLPLSDCLTNQNVAPQCSSDLAQDQRTASKSSTDWTWPLDVEEYKRYGRQMIMPEIGLQGQLQLKNASVLVVGVGGLGCPAATYLAGAGIGTLGLMDGDVVETSNLHRQILHTSDRVGWFKVTSAIEALTQQNPKIIYHAHTSHLEVATALDILDQYDFVLDCTDHPTSRYLISDAAVVARKPLVSASALRTEGQLLVLNNPPTTDGGNNGGMCYRCVFPRPPPADSVMSCGEGGILGPVVGVMGVLMAVEAIKIITAEKTPPPASQLEGSYRSNIPTSDAATPTLLIYSAYSSPPFRTMRLRGKRPNCPSCSASATITRQSFTSGSLNYASFCGIASPVKILSDEERISAQEYREIVKDTSKMHTLIDVREKTQYDLCHIEKSLNMPFSDIEASDGQDPGEGHSAFQHLISGNRGPIYFVCRFGNDSQVAVRRLKNTPGLEGKLGPVRDIKGGLAAWRRDVDPWFPEY